MAKHPKKKVRHLLQVQSKAVYVWTERLAQKDGFVEIDEDGLKRIKTGAKPTIHTFKPPAPKERTSLIFNKAEGLASDKSAELNFAFELLGKYGLTAETKRKIILETAEIISAAEPQTEPIQETEPGPPGNEEGYGEMPIIDPTKANADTPGITLAPETDLELALIMSLKTKNQLEEYALKGLQGYEINRQESVGKIKEDLTTEYKRLDAEAKANPADANTGDI